MKIRNGKPLSKDNILPNGQVLPSTPDQLTVGTIHPIFNRNPSVNKKLFKKSNSREQNQNPTQQTGQGSRDLPIKQNDSGPKTAATFDAVTTVQQRPRSATTTSNISSNSLRQIPLQSQNRQISKKATSLTRASTAPDSSLLSKKKQCNI